MSRAGKITIAQLTKRYQRKVYGFHVYGKTEIMRKRVRKYLARNPIADSFLTDQ